MIVVLSTRESPVTLQRTLPLDITAGLAVSLQRFQQKIASRLHDISTFITKLL